MTSGELAPALGALSPSVHAVALCALRLLPVTLLCPLLGGQAAPSTVRLGVVLSLALWLHVAAGIGLAQPPATVWELGMLAVREALLGTVLGLIAALPFDAARLGGRLVDLFRGTSAEAALPAVGTRESAAGDALYQLLTALALAGGALPLVLGALWRTFALVPLGAAVETGGLAAQVMSLTAASMGVGLAVGAPVAGCALAVDFLLGLVARAAPSLHLQETGAPLRILGGGAVLWLGAGVMAGRLLEELHQAVDVLRTVGEVVP